MIPNLVIPIFIVPGSGVRSPISSLPGHYYLSSDTVESECLSLARLGLTNYLIYESSKKIDKDQGKDYLFEAINRIKSKIPNSLVISDLCVCQNIGDGECTVNNHTPIGNDLTISYLLKDAEKHVAAGADMLMPSGMLDGIVSSLREHLDQNNYSHILIMNQSVKFSSAMYGPFRDAAWGSEHRPGKNQYQLQPSGVKESLLEINADEEECGDIVMVKPTLFYLDIISRVRAITTRPVAAFSTSGEYHLIMNQLSSDKKQRHNLLHSLLSSISRAGADILVSYFASDYMKLIDN